MYARSKVNATFSDVLNYYCIKLLLLKAKKKNFLGKKSLLENVEYFCFGEKNFAFKSTISKKKYKIFKHVDVISCIETKQIKTIVPLLNSWRT